MTAIQATTAEELVGAVQPARHQRRGMRRRIFSAVLPAIVFVVVVGGWELSSRTGLLNSYIAPAPSTIFGSLRTMATQPFFWHAVQITLEETLAGFGLGAGGGFAFGVLIALFPTARRALYPHAVAFQIIPRSALAPL